MNFLDFIKPSDYVASLVDNSNSQCILEGFKLKVKYFWTPESHGKHDMEKC